jgi:hypothetical protein
MVNLLGDTNAPSKPRPKQEIQTPTPRPTTPPTQNTSTSDLDVFVTGVPKSTPKINPKTIASDLMDVITPKPPAKAPTPTPIIPQRNDDVLDAYGSPKTEDENTCPEGYSKNYNRQGKLECLPNYNDKPEDGLPPNGTPCYLEVIQQIGYSQPDGVYKDGVCVAKGTNTPTTPTQVTKNLKPLIYGVGIIVGIIIVSKLLKKSN